MNPEALNAEERMALWPESAVRLRRLAAILAVGAPTLRRWERQGRIRAVRLRRNGYLIFEAGETNRLLENGL